VQSSALLACKVLRFIEPKTRTLDLSVSCGVCLHTLSVKQLHIFHRSYRSEPEFNVG